MSSMIGSPSRFSAPSLISLITSCGESDGLSAMSLAARFATFGDDMDVPENFMRLPPGM